MNRALKLLLLSALLATGCPTRIELIHQSDGGGAETTTVMPSLTITSPADGTYTNGTVNFSVTATGTTPPASIDLLDGSTSFATVSGSSTYVYAWNTATGVVDGPHTIRAHAKIDGQPINSAPITINVDHTSPQIAATTPLGGASNVVLRAPITVTFSEPLAAATVTADSVDLTVDGVSVPISLSLDSTAETLTISINDPTLLQLPNTFTVALSSGITDRVGNMLHVGAAPWSWTVPDWIKYAPIMTDLVPVVSIGPDFLPIVLTTSCTAGQMNCLHGLVVLASDGQVWKSVGQLNGLNGPGSLDLDSQGRPLVAGIQAASATAQMTIVSFGRWTGADWDTTSLPSIDAPAGSTVDQPVAHLDSSDNPVVTWIQTSPTASDVFAARWSGAQWDMSMGEVGAKAAGVATVAQQRMLLGSNGAPIVGCGDGGFGAVIGWNDTDWAANGGLFRTFDPFIALDSSSTPMIVDPDPQDMAFEIEHLMTGGQVSAAPTSIPVDAGTQYPHIASTPEGYPVVVFIDTTHSPANLAFFRWTGTLWLSGNGSFSGPEGPEPNEAPWITVDRRGSMWIAWREGTVGYVWMSNY